jgi:hypothetical protein
MSSGALSRADIREGREIIAEHQETDVRYVLDCLRPSGSPLGVQSIVISSGSVRNAD